MGASRHETGAPPGLLPLPASGRPEMCSCKVGLLADLHYDPNPERQRSWINPYDPPGIPRRVDLALRWFDEEAVDLVIVAGDMVEHPSTDALERVFGLVAGGGRRLCVVNGNHDWDPSGSFRSRAGEHGISLLDSAGIAVDGIAIKGVAAVPDGERAGPFRATSCPEAGEPSVIVSHFPLLSEKHRLEAAGLPYSGDLTNRGALARSLENDATHVLVLCGHIHARCSRSVGRVLQLSAGPLIESPYEAAVVSVAAGLGAVERKVRRFGPAAETDGTFSDDHERWRPSGNGWEREPPRPFPAGGDDPPGRRGRDEG